MHAAGIGVIPDFAFKSPMLIICLFLKTTSVPFIVWKLWSTSLTPKKYWRKYIESWLPAGTSSFWFRQRIGFSNSVGTFGCGGEEKSGKIPTSIFLTTPNYQISSLPPALKTFILTVSSWVCCFWLRPPNQNG